MKTPLSRFEVRPDLHHVRDADSRVIAECRTEDNACEIVGAVNHGSPGYTYLPVMVQLLNNVKAWRDSDGNEAFPLELRMNIDAMLMAYELRAGGPTPPGCLFWPVSSTKSRSQLRDQIGLMNYQITGLQHQVDCLTRAIKKRIEPDAA